MLEKLKLGFTTPVLGLPNILVLAESSFLVVVANEKPPAGDPAAAAWVAVFPPKLKLGLLALAGLPNKFVPAVGAVVFLVATAENENPPDAGDADGVVGAPPPSVKGLVAATAGVEDCCVDPLPNIGVAGF